MTRIPAPAATAALLLTAVLAWPAAATASEAGDAIAAWPGMPAVHAEPGNAQDEDPMITLLRARGALATSQAPAASATAHSARDPAAELVLAAMNFLDAPYRWGGTSAESGFDCSGFTRHVFATALGLALPRRSAEQARAVTLAPVARGELRPGDLVFFNTLRQAFSHVGLYIGDGRFVHAPRRGAQVRVESMRARYWASRFDGARRVAGQQPDGAGGIAGERMAR